MCICFEKKKITVGRRVALITQLDIYINILRRQTTRWVTFVSGVSSDACSHLGLLVSCSKKEEHHGCGCASHQWTALPAPGNHTMSCETTRNVVIIITGQSTWWWLHTRTSQTPAYLPSSSRTASVASLGSSNSTKANPGGFLATQTLRRGP